MADGGHVIFFSACATSCVVHPPLASHKIRVIPSLLLLLLLLLVLLIREDLASSLSLNAAAAVRYRRNLPSHSMDESLTRIVCGGDGVSDVVRAIVVVVVVQGRTSSKGVPDEVIVLIMLVLLLPTCVGSSL
jgi:hypothetical protein